MAEGVVCNAVHIVRIGSLCVQVGGALVDILLDENLHPADRGERGLMARPREASCWSSSNKTANFDDWKKAKLKNLDNPLLWN